MPNTPNGRRTPHHYVSYQDLTRRRCRPNAGSATASKANADLRRNGCRERIVQPSILSVDRSSRHAETSTELFSKNWRRSRPLPCIFCAQPTTHRVNLELLLTRSIFLTLSLQQTFPIAPDRLQPLGGSAGLEWFSPLLFEHAGSGDVPPTFPYPPWDEEPTDVLSE